MQSDVVETLSFGIHACWSHAPRLVLPPCRCCPRLGFHGHSPKSVVIASGQVAQVSCATRVASFRRQSCRHSCHRPDIEMALSLGTTDEVDYHQEDLVQGAFLAFLACLHRVANSSELRFLLFVDGMLCNWCAARAPVLPWQSDGGISSTNEACLIHLTPQFQLHNGIVRVRNKVHCGTWLVERRSPMSRVWLSDA